MPQRLFFSKVDEESGEKGEKGERRVYAYEVRKGDTLRGVARRLGVRMDVVVGAEPLWVDGEFE